ncbi:MAG: TonB-dependent siderophore receptor [Pseudomonadota bacterium]
MLRRRGRTGPSFLRANLCANLCALAFSGLALNSYAAEPAADTSWRVVEEVLVTESRGSPYQNDKASVLRMDVPLLDWPQAVQVLNRTLLDEQALTTLTEALSNVSGVVPNHEQETVLVNPFVRGQEAEIYLDGLVGYGDTAVIDPSSLAVIERLEVAKGPTSVLFGGGLGAPTGGLINLVTKTPARETERVLSLRGGSFSTRAAAVDWNQPITEALGVRLAGEVFRSDDMIDAVNVDRLTLNPSLRAQLSEGTQLTVRGLYNEIEQLEYTGLPAAVADLPAVDPLQFTGAANAPPTRIRNLSIHADLARRFNETVSGRLQLRRFENEFDEFSSFPFLSFFPLDGTEAAIIRGQLPVETDEWTLDASVQLSIEGNRVGHEVLAGLMYDRTDYWAGSGFDFAPIGVIDYAAGENTLDFGTIPALNATTANEYRTLAAYVQDSIAVGERVRILVSARLSRYELQEVEGGTGADEVYTEFDPRIGVTFRLSDRVALYTGYATGSRMVPFFTGVNSAPPVPEESESVEAGLKFSRFLDGRLSGSIALFRIDRERIPATDLSDPFFGSVQNGEQRSEGVEFDLIYEPTAQWSVLANAAYVDARNQSDIASFGTIFAAGNALSRIPRTSGRIAARYRVSRGPLAGLGVGAGMTYADEAPLTDANEFFSDRYAVFDFQADYVVGAATVRLNIVNLGDREYFRPYQYLLQEVVRPGQERSAFVTLELSL